MFCKAVINNKIPDQADKISIFRILQIIDFENKAELLKLKLFKHLSFTNKVRDIFEHNNIANEILSKIAKLTYYGYNLDMFGTEQTKKSKEKMSEEWERVFGKISDESTKQKIDETIKLMFKRAGLKIEQ